MINAVVRRFGLANSVLLFFFPLAVAIAWFGSAITEYQRFITWGLKFTHQWLEMWIRFTRFINFDWMANQLMKWNSGLPPHIQVEYVVDVPDWDLFHVWLVWFFSAVAIWILWSALSLLFGNFSLPAAGEGSSGGSSGGGSRGGGFSRSAEGKWAFFTNYPISLLLIIVILMWPGLTLYDKVQDRFDDHRTNQAYQERLNIAGCVPDDENILPFDAVDYCVGILNGSSASKATKESLTIMLSATCYAYEGYASDPTATHPAWELRAARELDSSAYGAKAQWIADQGIPCSLPDSNEPGPEKNFGWMIFWIFVVPATLVAAGLFRRPKLDGAGDPLPFRDQFKSWQLRTVLFALLMIPVYFLFAGYLS